MNKELNLSVIPKIVSLKLNLNFTEKFLNYIESRYQPFIIKESCKSCYCGFLNRNLTKCEKCYDKELVENSDFRRIKVCFSVSSKIFCFFSLENKYLFDSTLRIIYSIILAQNNGLLLHSAGFINKNSGILYVGPTNSGKSTLSKKVPLKNVLSDELCPVVVNEPKVFCWKSPFYSEVKVLYDDLRFYRLTKMFFLSGFDTRRKVFSLNNKEALVLLLKNVFWLVKNKELTEKLLDTSQKILNFLEPKKICLERYEV